MKFYCFPMLVIHSSCKRPHGYSCTSVSSPLDDNFKWNNSVSLFLRKPAFQLQPAQNFWPIWANITEISLPYSSSTQNDPNHQFQTQKQLSIVSTNSSLEVGWIPPNRWNTKPSTGVWLRTPKRKIIPRTTVGFLAFVCLLFKLKLTFLWMQIFSSEFDLILPAINHRSSN